MTTRASVVFPEPDSPTSARHSRAWSSSETPSNRTCRCRGTRRRRHRRARARAASAAASRPGKLARAAGRARRRGSRRRCGRRDRDRRRLRLAQAGSTSGQRGANTQPVGTRGRAAARGRGSPRATRAPRCPGSPRSACACTGAPGARRARRAGPSSTMRARVHDRARDRRARDHGEVVADIERCRRRDSGTVRARSPARAPGSSRRDRSSARRARSPAGRSRNAIAMQTRCCWPPESWCG